jgi:predicted transcriptional regulator
LEDLADRAFGGNTKKLVMSLVSAERLTVEEVQEMQRLVSETKGKKQ